MKLEYTQLPEANIQAEFYRLCIQYHIPVLLEYSYKNSRFDAVVYNPIDKEIHFIVEVKSYRRLDTTPKPGNKQKAKYSKHGVPVLWIGGMHDVLKTIVKIKKALKLKGIPLPKTEEAMKELLPKPPTKLSPSFYRRRREMLETQELRNKPFNP